MKTEAAFLSYYNSNPLVAVDPSGEKEARERLKKVAHKDPFKNNHHFYVIEGSVNESKNWDEDWFGNYE